MMRKTRASLRCALHRSAARARDVVALALVLLVAVMATAGPALAEQTVTLCFDSTGSGRNVRGWLPDQTSAHTYWAGVLNVRVDGTGLRAFCIDIHNRISPGRCYDSSTFGVTSGWVARTIADYPAEASLSDTEAAARQAAIWYFSDGFVLDPSYNVSIYARAQAIIQDIEAKCSSGACDPLLPPQLSLDPVSEVDWLAPDGQGGFLEDVHTLTVTVTRGSEPVAGAEVTVSTTVGELSWGAASGSSITVATGADGTATVLLTHDAVGTAVVTATYVASFPTGTIINPGIDVQKVVIGESFGYPLTASATKQWGEGERIIVQKFDDANGNGIQDDGESLIDWTISYREHGSGDPWTSVALGDDGSHVLGGLEPGLTWDVREEPRSGWLATTPTLVEAVTPPAVIKFGNLELSTIIVAKYHDLDGDGTRGADEPGLSGWGYALYRDTSDGWSSSGFDTTGSAGLASFNDLAANGYRVVELAVSGWYTSTPATVDLELNAGSVYTATFGNLQTGSLVLNKSWLWDEEPVDPPDAPATGCVRRTGPGTPAQDLVPTDGDGTTLTPNGDGWYCQPITDQVVFQNLWPGVYEIDEMAPAGWLAAPVSDVTLLSGAIEERTIENTLQPGSLTVTKVVAWGDLTPDADQAFTITLTGPSYPSGDSKVVGYLGGDVTWEDLEPGTYTVTEVDPGAAWSVTGSGVGVEVASGESANATITNAARVGSISGVKYNDLSGSGTRKDGEPGIEGWIVELDGPTGLITTTTDANGSYSFSGLPMGSYTLCEGEGPWPDGAYVQTEPAGGACHTANVGADEVWSFEGLDFGNHLEPTFECLTVFGHKWHDLNGDGQWDDGEPAIEGWVISLTDGAAVLTTTTDASGYYSFEVCEQGTYTVSEETRVGWVASTAASYSFEAASGQDVGPVDFGNYEPFECVEIDGFKWHDLNGDGDWDSGEPAIEGWVISLSDGEVTLTTTTDAEGYYSFQVCEPGTYTVSEEMQDGWVATTATQVTVEITEYSARVDFGNRLEPQAECGVVHGFKWNDLNGDGEWQQGEPALEGWEIVLERVEAIATGDPTPQPMQRVTHTDEDGYYRFEEICEPGVYQVREVQQEGWIATTPMEVLLQNAWEGTTRVDFGNRSEPGDRPTPEPCIRSDVSVIIYGGWNDIPVRAWVGGTEQETLYTKLNSFGEPQTMWTFYPPETEHWVVSAQPELPAGLDPDEWEYKLVRTESPTEGWVNDNPASASVKIRRCEEYVIYFQLVHTGAKTEVPTPWELPKTGHDSGDDGSAALLIGLLALLVVSGTRMVVGFVSRRGR
ncbi:MAG: SdrD B-like domain-containing protein [Anaerolineae bacterium]